MTVIAVQPIVLKDCQLIIDIDDYAAHVASVLFTPTSSTVTRKGLTPAAVFSEGTSPTWECTLDVTQDWTTPESLANYLWDHAGETKTCRFQPKKGSSLPEFTADLILAKPAVGGAVDNVAASQVTLGVDGEPAKGAAA